MCQPSDVTYATEIPLCSGAPGTAGGWSGGTVLVYATVRVCVCVAVYATRRGGGVELGAEGLCCSLNILPFSLTNLRPQRTYCVCSGRFEVHYE